jgi:acetyltransferase-like isoleucine patch superfamily enzyme
MNISRLIDRLFGRQIPLKKILNQNYTLGDNSVIHEEAEIINNLPDKDKIIIGSNTHIKGQLLTFAHGGRIKIGEYCFVGKNTYIWSAKSIKIGNRVLISHNCNIFDSDTHPLDPKKRHEQCKAIITSGHPAECGLDEEPVVIEDDAWIAVNSIIFKGVTIGNGAIVGAGKFIKNLQFDEQGHLKS